MLVGCTSPGPLTGERDSPTMKEIYDEHFLTGSASRKDVRPRALRADTSIEAMERKQAIDERFGRVRNPMLLMYVFPRLDSTENVPIPGFWTAFSMYLSNEYALAGEEMEHHVE